MSGNEKRYESQGTASNTRSVSLKLTHFIIQKGDDSHWFSLFSFWILKKNNFILKITFCLSYCSLRSLWKDERPRPGAGLGPFAGAVTADPRIFKANAVHNFHTRPPLSHRRKQVLDQVMYTYVLYIFVHSMQIVSRFMSLWIVKCYLPSLHLCAEGLKWAPGRSRWAAG